MLLAAGAVLYALSFPASRFWALSFVAMAPALVATSGLRPWTAFRCGFGFGFLIAALGLTWFWDIFGPGACALWAVLGVWFGVFFAGRAVLERGLRPWAALLATIAWWTAVEFFRAECYPLRCTFLCLGHALAVQGSPLKMLARWVGAYGLGTLVIAVNVTLAYAVLTKGVRRLVPLLAGAAVLVAFFAVALGMELMLPEEETAGVRVALIQCEPGNLNELRRLSLSVMPRIPRWILWPELSVMEDVKANEKTRLVIEQTAQQRKVIIGVGARLAHPAGGSRFWNAYLLFDKTGKISGEYHKVQPVPFMNDGEPGSDYNVLDTAYGRLGVAICYDGDFTWIPRRLVANGAQVLVIPIYDPAEWGTRMREQHIAASVLRAIENARYVARPANAAPTLVIGPYGKITQRLDAPGPGALVSNVVPSDFRTVYGRFGWLWPYVCQGLSVLLVLYAFVRSRKRGRQVTQ